MLRISFQKPLKQGIRTFLFLFIRHRVVISKSIYIYQGLRSIKSILRSGSFKPIRRFLPSNLFILILAKIVAETADNKSKDT